MDPNEVFEYLTRGIELLAIGSLIYTGGLLGLAIAHVFSQRINSQDELEERVTEEALKLGLDPLSIKAKYNGVVNGVRKNGEYYDLHLTGDNLLCTNRAGVRHELYHVHRGDMEHSSFFRYFFLEEPRALLYGSLKIKL